MNEMVSSKAMIYSLLRQALFCLDPETAHAVTLKALDVSANLGLVSDRLSPSSTRVHVMGIEFPNRVGLAAGLDKDGAHLNGLSKLGFGFIEVGTVTPRPQPGNPRPRLFRLPEAPALINRLGFNNVGVTQLLANLDRSNYRGVLGINIGKNFDTPIDSAIEDYLYCLRAVYARATYVAVNVSSPNTEGLRQLQAETALVPLLETLKLEQHRLAEQYDRYVPLLVKVAPDLEPSEIEMMAKVFLQQRVDGIIATNTTIARESVKLLRYGNETGGLSGAPLRQKATSVLGLFAQELHGEIPLIGVGGIFSGRHAQEKIEAGASLVQLYTGLVYRGAGLIAECARTMSSVANSCLPER